MICFRDRTFCQSDCTNTGCFRHFGPDDREDAIRWWGSDEAPIAFSDFSGSCEAYIRPEDTPSEFDFD
jgi:hypothetical protein